MKFLMLILAGAGAFLFGWLCGVFLLPMFGLDAKLMGVVFVVVLYASIGGAWVYDKLT